jgi:hypothetical protein
VSVGPGSKTVEQLTRRRTVERLLVERHLVPELHGEGIELSDAVEIRRWSESVVVEQVEQEADRVRAREIDPMCCEDSL